MSVHIDCAKIDWQSDEAGNATPISQHFGDVYFSKTGGLAETDYVFLQGNQLADRFAALSAYESFVVGETGFGTGLNFLATCLLWQKYAPKTARLHFISTEKYPLTSTDFAKALSVWRTDETASVIDALIANYPLPLAGCHRLHIGERIVLDLWIGDAKDSLNALIATQTKTTARVDAWFLDGFAPSKNSEMWSDELFAQMAALSHRGSTLATFTAAGFVRRSLMAAGFTVNKIKGFGRKREMLTAIFHGDAKPKQASPRKHIAIIGAGISGMMSAFALARRGHRITLLDKNAPMSGASGNPRALFAPKLTLLAQATQHLPTVSFLYAHRIYRALNTDHRGVFEQTGVVDFLLPTQKSVDKLAAQIAAYPDALISQQIPAKYNAAISASIPMAGLLNPKRIGQSVLTQPNIHFMQRDITQIIYDENGVQLIDNQGKISADAVAICAGFQSELLDDTLFICRKIRGQLSWARFAGTLDQPIKYDGYCASFNENETQLLFGASFVRNNTSSEICTAEHQENLAKLTAALPDIAAKLDTSSITGKASVRAQTPDYHPLLGKITDKSNIYTLYGMGSKGFSFAPLCGEILADLIDGTILPIHHTLLEKLSPQRARLQIPLKD